MSATAHNVGSRIQPSTIFENRYPRKTCYVETNYVETKSIGLAGRVSLLVQSLPVVGDVIALANLAFRGMGYLLASIALSSAKGKKKAIQQAILGLQPKQSEAAEKEANLIKKVNQKNTELTDVKATIDEFRALNMAEEALKKSQTRGSLSLKQIVNASKQSICDARNSLTKAKQNLKKATPEDEEFCENALTQATIKLKDLQNNLLHQLQTEAGSADAKAEIKKLKQSIESAKQVANAVGHDSLRKAQFELQVAQKELAQHQQGARRKFGRELKALTEQENMLDTSINYATGSKKLAAQNLKKAALRAVPLAGRLLDLKQLFISKELVTQERQESTSNARGAHMHYIYARDKNNNLVRDDKGNLTPIDGKRFPVPEKFKDLKVEFHGYEPTDFTDGTVNGAVWADPKGEAWEVQEALIRKDLTYDIEGGFETITAKHFENGKEKEFKFRLDENGLPINPIERTGMTGRGLLGKYGPNRAADPIVSVSVNGKLVGIIAIQRADTGEWAIPGGMVDPQEPAKIAAIRELFEEALSENAIDALVSQFTGIEEERPAYRTRLESCIARFKETLESGSNGKKIYEGYVDDPRNTDQAWMETTAYHFTVNFNQDEFALFKQLLTPQEGEALSVAIKDPKEITYASHASLIQMALAAGKKEAETAE